MWFDPVFYWAFWFAMAVMFGSMVMRVKHVLLTAYRDLEQANGLRQKKEWLWNAHIWGEFLMLTVWIIFLAWGMELIGTMSGKQGRFFALTASACSVFDYVRTYNFYKLYTVGRKDHVSGG